ncbi:MAG: NnrS family protein, partial [Gammaproteobacteria bacterium]
MYSHPLWSIGFRPLFLLSGIASVLLIFIWGMLFQYGVFPHNYYSPTNWHAHEML